MLSIQVISSISSSKYNTFCIIRSHCSAFIILIIFFITFLPECRFFLPKSWLTKSRLTIALKRRFRKILLSDFLQQNLAVNFDRSSFGMKTFSNVAKQDAQ